MEATLLDIDFSAELRRIHRQRSVGRFPGLHLSTIVHRLALDVGRYDKAEFPDAATLHQGFVFEDLMSEMFARQWGLRQIYADLDGVEMSMDGFGGGRVKEVKFSKISARHPISDFRFWHWRVRTMGYCKAMGVRGAEILILHVNGSYELGGGRFGKVVMQGHRLEWTQREIDENWKMCLRKRDLILGEGKEDTS